MNYPILISVALVFILTIWWLTATRRKGCRSTNGELISPVPLDLTVLFSNLDDLVPIFERIGYQAGAIILNEYYSVMTPIVRSHGGYIYQYAFDRIFCSFGPTLNARRSNHAAEAIHAVLDMQNAMGLLNDRLTAKGLPRVRMRAGIATGDAIVGDVGTPEFSAFTAIGPAVDLAKRLEQACRASDSSNLVNAQARLRTLSLFRFQAVKTPLADGETSMEVFEALGRL